MIAIKCNLSHLLFLTLILLSAGCTPTNSIETQETKKENVVGIVDDKYSEEEFSYLTDLSEDELELYKLFSKEYDINYLKSFSPEKIILVYMHSAVIDDIEAIYSLAYRDGEISDFENFKEKYYQNLSITNSELALDFRYYDSIKIKQEDSNGLIVELSVSYGKFTASALMSVKKESNIWKIVLPD